MWKGMRFECWGQHLGSFIAHFSTQKETEPRHNQNSFPKSSYITADRLPRRVIHPLLCASVQYSMLRTLQYGILLLYTKRVLLHEFSKKTGWYHHYRIDRSTEGWWGWMKDGSPPSVRLLTLFADWGGISRAVSLSGFLYTVQSITYLATTAKFLFCFVCLFREWIFSYSFFQICMHRTDKNKS